MTLALSCGVCEYLLLEYSAPGAPIYLLMLCAAVAVGTALLIMLSRQSIGRIAFQLILLLGLIAGAFMVYGAYTFIGAIICFMVGVAFLNKKIVPLQRKPFVGALIWCFIGIFAIALVPYCANYYIKAVQHSPERMVKALIDGQITARIAEKQLKALPASLEREGLAMQLSKSLVDQTKSHLMIAGNKRILSVLVEWKAISSIPYIIQAKEKKLIDTEIADQSITKMNKSKGA